MLLLCLFMHVTAATDRDIVIRIQWVLFTILCSAFHLYSFKFVLFYSSSKINYGLDFQLDVNFKLFQLITGCRWEN